jgi:amino acid transporter
MTSREAPVTKVSPQEAALKDAPLSAQLGTGSIILMVLAAAAPLSVVAGLSPIGILAGNGQGFPATFIVIALVLLIFSVGFTTMTPKVRESGGFYSYIRAGRGFPAGMGATTLAIFSYVAMQVGMYPYAGLLISNFLSGFGIAMPWWLIALVLLAGVGYLGYRNIDFSAKVLAVLLIAEIVVVTVVSFAIIGQGGAEGLSLESFSPETTLSGNIALGLTFAISSFLGFESTAVYRDEARDPSTTIPRATYGAVLIVAFVYSFATWAFVQGWGSQVVSAAADSMATGDMYQQTAERYVGTWLALVINVLLVTSLLACILSWHNVTARYLFTNGRSGALPAYLGRQSIKHRSPGAGSITVAAVIAAITLVFVIIGLDPYSQIYTWFTAVGVVGVVLLMLVVSISTITYFARHRAERRGLSAWKRAIAPTVAAIALTVLFVLIITNFAVLVGETDAEGAPSPGPVTWSILSATILSAVLGTL